MRIRLRTHATGKAYLKMTMGKIDFRISIGIKDAK